MSMRDLHTWNILVRSHSGSAFGAALTTKLYRSKLEEAKNVLLPRCLRNGLRVDTIPMCCNAGGGPYAGASCWVEYPDSPTTTPS